MRAFWANLWQRRWFRWTFTPVAAVVLSWCCICLILNYAGEKRWQKVKARLEAEGETFDYFTLLPKPIPDEQNFCAIEPLKGLRDPKNHAQRAQIEAQTALFTPQIKAVTSFAAFGRAEGPDNNALLRELGIWAEHLPQSGKRSRVLVPTVMGLPPLPGLPGPTSSHTSSVPVQPRTPVAVTWQEARSLLEKHAPLLPQLTKAAKLRRQADYLPRPTREELPELLFSQSLKHIQVFQQLAELCRFYSLICMKAEDNAASLDAALVLLRLARASDMSASLVGSLGSSNQQAVFIQTIWLYLRERCFEDAALALIQEELRQIDPALQHLVGLRAEMIWRANSIDYLQAHREQRWATFRTLPMLGASPVSSGIAPALVAVAPGGFFSLSKASSTEFFLDRVIQPLKQCGLAHAETRIGSLEDHLAHIEDWQRPDLFLTKLGFAPLDAVRRQVVLTANQRLQAILACALERHYLRHHSYPAGLDALDPEFRTGVSLLDVDGDSMRYVQSSDGRFRLWSPGPNGVDDGGKFGEEVAPGSTKSLTNSKYRGDWVWRYEPAVKAP